jgi:hypothetical protein
MLSCTFGVLICLQNHIIYHSQAITAAAGQASLCNPSSEECYAFKPIRDPAKLVFNLENAFARNHTITYMHRGGIEFKRFKLTFPEDGDDYRCARDTGSYYNRGRVPAAIVYAESEEDVVKAVKSATDAGYNIAPRGRGHQYQGLSTMDGYVVIDCSLLCDPDSFEIEKNLDLPWILPNQRMIGSIKAGAGCTNAVLLGSAHQHFADEGGVYQEVGTCPSVGIVGK